MFGISNSEIERIIESEMFSLTAMSKNNELKSLASRMAKEIAKAINANNEAIKRQVDNEIKMQIRNIAR